MLLQIEFERTRDGRCFGRRSFQFERKSSLFDGFGCGLAEASQLDAAVFEVGNVLEQRLYACRGEENDHIEVEGVVFWEGIADGAIHDTLRVVEFLCFQHKVELIAVYVALRNEILLSLVLSHNGHQVGQFSSDRKSVV